MTSAALVESNNPRAITIDIDSAASWRLETPVPIETKNQPSQNRIKTGIGQIPAQIPIFGSPRESDGNHVLLGILFEILVEPGYHPPLLVIVVYMTGVGVDDALELLGLVVELVELGQDGFEFAHPSGWRAGIAVARKR